MSGGYRERDLKELDGGDAPGGFTLAPGKRNRVDARYGREPAIDGESLVHLQEILAANQQPIPELLRAALARLMGEPLEGAPEPPSPDRAPLTADPPPGSVNEEEVFADH